MTQITHPALVRSCPELLALRQRAGRGRSVTQAIATPPPVLWAALAMMLVVSALWLCLAGGLWLLLGLR